MKRNSIWSWIFFLLLSCNHITPSKLKDPAYDIETNVSQDKCYNVVKYTSTVKMSLNTLCIPNKASFVEVVFGNIYFGIFSINQPIYLPMYKGKQKLVLNFQDEIGKSLSVRKEYILE